MKKYRIVIIDDNDGDVLLLREAFRTADMAAECLTFTDGDEALRHVRESASPADAIVLDMHLPTLDAVAILDAIRGNQVLSGVPVILLSSSVSRADRERMKAYGLARHLEKPDDLDEFLKIGTVVREVVEEAASRR